MTESLPEVLSQLIIQFIGNIEILTTLGSINMNILVEKNRTRMLRRRKEEPKAINLKVFDV